MADLNYFHTNNFDQRTPPYLVFGLRSKGYSPEDVNAAYKKLMRVYHPDKNSGTFHQHRFETVTKFINKKRAQILQGLRGKTPEPDNPAGEEVCYEVVPDSIVVFKMDSGMNTNDQSSKDSKDSQDSENDRSDSQDGVDDDEDEDEEEEYVDVEDEADTQGVQYHPPSEDADDEELSSNGNDEDSSNGNVSTTGDAVDNTYVGDMCGCKNRAPHYHLIFQADNTVRCPLCTTTHPNTTANKGSLAQHVKTVHKQRCFTMNPNKKPPMTSKERVRKYRAKKKALQGALCRVIGLYKDTILISTKVKICSSFGTIPGYNPRKKVLTGNFHTVWFSVSSGSTSPSASLSSSSELSSCRL